MEEEKIVGRITTANRYYALLNREISMHEDPIQVPTVKKKKKKNKHETFGPPKPIVDQGDPKDGTLEECVGSAVKEKNQLTSDPLDMKKKDNPTLSVGGKKAKNNYEKFGPPMQSVDRVYLKDGTSEECVGSALKEKNQMTSDALDIKKKDVPPFSIGAKKKTKKNYAPQSKIEKRVKRIIREAGGVTDDGNPIDKEVLKKYLLEIEESEGFYFSEFPGSIDEVTEIYPNQIVLDDRYDCPEDYAKILFLATLAVAKYNTNHGTYFKVVEIEHLNVSVFSNYITFSAIEVRGTKKGSFLRFFIHAFYIIFTLSLLCCCFCQKARKLIREWHFFAFKANEDDLQDKNAVRSTFRALVIVGVRERKRDVVFCKLVK